MNNRIVFLLVILLPACDFENPYYNKLYGSWTCNGNGVGLAADTYYHNGKFTRYQSENKKMIYEEGSFTLEDNYLKVTIKRSASRMTVALNQVKSAHMKVKYKKLSSPIVYQYKINRLSLRMLDFKSANESDQPLYKQPQQTCRKVSEQRIGFFYASAKLGRLQKRTLATKIIESPLTLVLSNLKSNNDHATEIGKLASRDVSLSHSPIKSIGGKIIVQKDIPVTKTKILLANNNQNTATKVARIVKSDPVSNKKSTVARTVLNTNRVVIVVRNETQTLSLQETERQQQNLDVMKIKAISAKLNAKNNGRVIITINKPNSSIMAASKKSKERISQSKAADLIVAKPKANLETTPDVKADITPKANPVASVQPKPAANSENKIAATSVASVQPKPAANSENKIAANPVVSSQPKLAATSDASLVNQSIAKLERANTKSKTKLNIKSEPVNKLEKKTVVTHQLGSDPVDKSDPDKTIEKLIKRQNSLAQQIKFLDNFQRDRNRAYDTLRSLSLAMVPGINVKSIEQNKSIFLVNGYASSRSRVKSFVKRLSRSPHIKKVNIKRIKVHQKRKLFLIKFQQAHSVKSYQYLYIRPAVIQQNVLGAGRRVRELRAIRDRLLKRFPNEKEAKILVRKLKWKAKKVGLRIISFKQKKDKTLKDHILSQVQIVAVGDYDSIVVFLNRLGRRKHVNQVRSLKLNVQKDIDNKSEKFKSLHVSMTLNLFRVPNLQKQRQRIPNLKYRFVKLSPYNRVPYSDDTGIINPFKYIVGRYTDYCNGPLSYEQISKVKLVAVLNRKKKMALLKAANGKIYRARFGTCIARNTKISRITQKSVIMKTVEMQFGRPKIMVRNIKLQAK